MTETFTMKYIFFLFATFSFQFVLGIQSFSGFMTKKGADYYFTPKSSSILYRINPATTNVQASLDRLGSGDFIAGNGSLDTINRKLTVASVDYVGLRKLLGPWTGPEGTMLFKDFTTMRFTPRFRDIDMDSNLSTYQKEFRYSITPSDGNEWGVFLSDEKSTTFATVEFTKNKVIMKIFESESGKIVRTLKLERP